MKRFLILLKSGLRPGVSTFAAVSLWGISMFLVYEKNYATPGSIDLSDIPIDKAATARYENWMTVRMGGNKIGYAMQSLADSPLGYVLKEYSLLQLPMGGTVREIYLDSYAVLNLDFSLKTFTFSLISGEYTTDVFGEVQGGKLRIKMRSQNSESSAVFDAEKGIYLPGVVPIMASIKKFPQGEFYLSSFDPLSISPSEIGIFVGPQEEISTELGRRKGHRLSLHFSGMTTYMWVDNKGRVLREEEAGDMVMVATDRERALDMSRVERGDSDILTELAVPCQGRIAAPRDCRYLKVMIKGIEPGMFDLDDDFQTVVSTDPLILEMHPRDITGSTLGDDRRFKSPQPLIQAHDPRIVEASRQIVGDETEPERIAEKIGVWVFEEVDKDLTISLPSAVDVLAVKRGDCNEHTSLYTALARAAELPTKICIGIVYKDGFFYYHAWPAVHLAGWKPLDPTFGQEIADATHIKLLEGGFERQADLMRVVGKISVTILEQSSGESL